ncbi:MAG: Arginine--tRNA ligase, partial [Patescibacteria group bacterium]|nr:Arginine--tRNA ligase [Patescibacteria group bacterium]
MKAHLTAIIRESVESAQQQGLLADFVLPTFQVDRPEEAAFGEYTSNVALMAAKISGLNPR